MVDKYAKAYVEVIAILKTLPKEEYLKIPKEKIIFYEQNMDKNYEFYIDTNKEISDLKISREANAVLINLFRDYFATDKQKEILNNLLKQNEQKIEKEKLKKYNSNAIFEKSKDNKNEPIALAIIEKEKWYKRILNYFKRILLKR